MLGDYESEKNLLESIKLLLKFVDKPFHIVIDSSIIIANIICLVCGENIQNSQENRERSETKT